MSFEQAIFLSVMRRKRKGLLRDYWIATETELWYFFTIANDPLQRGFTISVSAGSNGSVSFLKAYICSVKLIREIGPLIIYTIFYGSVYGNVSNHSPTIWLEN